MHCSVQASCAFLPHFMWRFKETPEPCRYTANTNCVSAGQLQSECVYVRVRVSVCKRVSVFVRVCKWVCVCVWNKSSLTLDSFFLRGNIGLWRKTICLVARLPSLMRQKQI